MYQISNHKVPERFLSRVKGKFYDVCPKCVGPNTELHATRGFHRFPSGLKTFEETFPPVTQVVRDLLPSGFDFGHIEVLFTKGWEQCDSLVIEGSPHGYMIFNLMGLDGCRATMSDGTLTTDVILDSTSVLNVDPEVSITLDSTFFRNTKAALLLVHGKTTE